MNMLSWMTELVRNGVGGSSWGGRWSGVVGREAVSSQSLLSLGQKEREKAQQGERSLAALQYLASRRPHLVPAECPQWAWPHCLHSDLSTEDHCLPVSTTPFDLSLSSPSNPPLLPPPPPLYFGNGFITAKTEMFQNWFVKAMGWVLDQTTSGMLLGLCFFLIQSNLSFTSWSKH